MEDPQSTPNFDSILSAIRAPDALSADDSSSLRASLLRELGLDRQPTKDEIRADLQRRFLTPREKLPEHWLGHYQLTWDRPTSLPTLLQAEPSAPSTHLSFLRAGLEGRITGYTERPLPRASRETSKTSTSLARAPGDLTSFVRGRSGNFPFAPGGLNLGDEKEGARRRYGIGGEGIGEEGEDGEAVDLGRGGLRTVPPGFERGLDFGDSEDDPTASLSLPSTSAHPHSLGAPAFTTAHSTTGGSVSSKAVDPQIDDLLPTSRPAVAPTTTATARGARKPRHLAKREWAHVVDVNKRLENFEELVPDMAKTYPFTLDTFQQTAVYHLEMGDSVFVAAHTSAGKTVVAEYAIALASKHMTRAIYTSPIKALSNQKFRDFKTTFDPSTVGILTGDVQINPDASCLIMTTEILRSMLYKGADLIRDVEFVIFDEVHYVNDAERGVVWEEVIIMLPEHVNIILLSATVPNAKEFADWVGRTKRKDIYVISTPKRPVPLEHHLYAGRELHKIVDASGQFLGTGYKEAGEALRKKQDKEREAAGLPPIQRTGGRGGARGGAPTGRGQPSRGASAARGVARSYMSRGAGPNRGGGAAGNGDRNLWVHLVGHLKKKDLLPVVIFTFSKRRCEENAGTLGGQDLCSAAEKSEVHVVIERSLTRLKGSDKKLPQIARMRDLLSRGIAVHHGGLLPIVKEIVELLFARGLVKVLFATETFAMGVNMPARSVAFSGIRKHDGKSFRELLPGEYTQMSGRAGRRGLDPTGVVIIISGGDELPEYQTLHQMILGVPNKLQSQFRLTFNLILNLLRVEALRVEDMIKRSFSENASQRLLPDQQKRVVDTEKRLAAMPKLDRSSCPPEIDAFYDLSARLADINQYIVDFALGHPQGSKILAPGRVVVLQDGHFRGNLGVLLRPSKFLPPGATQTRMKYYWVIALADEQTKSGAKEVDPESVPPRWPPALADQDADPLLYDLITVPATSISVATKYNFKDVDVSGIVDSHRRSALQAAADFLKPLLAQVHASAASSDAPLAEVDWSKLRGLEFQDALRERDTLLQRMRQMEPNMLYDEFERDYAVLHSEKLLHAKLADLKMAVSDQNLELLPDYENRVQVLKELKFIDDNSTVLLKGRVACEINSANELVATELILENTLAAYEPEEVVALLSAFVFQEKTEVEPMIPPKLEEGRDTIYAIADRVQRVLDYNKVHSEDFETKLQFGLVEVVYEWAKGMPFEQIASLTDVAEGTIVRCITRLDQLCLEVRDAARVIGDAALFQKMEQCQTMIKRDIVFAASLYV